MLREKFECGLSTLVATWYKWSLQGSKTITLTKNASFLRLGCFWQQFIVINGWFLVESCQIYNTISAAAALESAGDEYIETKVDMEFEEFEHFKRIML